MDWATICEDPALADLPYKIETDERGNIIMSPAKGWHGYYQIEIGHLIRKLLPQGVAYAECPVETSKGTKVPDIGWYERDRILPHLDDASFPIAPDICVEVISESNSPEEMEMKKALYFAKGAREFWTCNRAGQMTFENPAGPLDRSELCTEFPATIGF